MNKVRYKPTELLVLTEERQAELQALANKPERYWLRF